MNALAFHDARWRASLAAVGAATLMVACGGGDDPPVVEIKTVSNRADMVSGGDVLVEVVVPQGTSASGLKASLGGNDVSSAFAVRANGRALGVLTGLQNGENVLTVSIDGARTAQLKITNAPASGPIFSGPHSQPLFCATPVPQPATATTPASNASGLTGQPSAECMVASEFKLYYKTTSATCTSSLPDPVLNVPAASTTPPTSATPPANACFKPYTTGTTPADLATTTTESGATVPFIVRVERGTVNRAIYDLAVLFDPTKPWTAVAAQSQWNSKLLLSFGGSTGQPRRQSRSQSAWTSPDTVEAIGRGFMVATSNHFDGALNSNRVLMAETIMMLKERVADNYGALNRTIGSGGSGGAITQGILNIVFPGVLDGSIISAAYPDQETVVLTASDCTLLTEAFDKPAWLALMAGKTQAEIDAKKTAITGMRDPSSCQSSMSVGSTQRTAAPGLYFQRSSNLLGVISQSATPTNTCDLPPSLVYNPNDPATQNLPRCDMFSTMKNVYGVDAVTGNGKQTRDNVGVQYGLLALQQGAITAEEFVTLNEIVGGFDRNLQYQSGRSVADTDALGIAYRVGTMSSGKHLAKTPVIDLRGWNDSLVNLPPGAPTLGYGFHFVFMSFAIQDRYVRDVGSADNRAMWRFARTQLTPPGNMSSEALTSIDQWISGVQADQSQKAIEEKIRTARPASAANYCLLPQDASQSTKIFDAAVCDADPYLKPSLSPRQVAGAPRTEDVLKCQLAPLNVSAYGSTTFTAGQLARLNGTFASGVCDWTKPGVGQQDPAGPLTFKAGPGGQPLGGAPTSTPI